MNSSKSTFLKLALGLLKPTSGTVERKEEKIAYISQSTSLGDISFPATVEEIVYLGLVDNAIAFSQTHGGGGSSPDDDWGRKPGENDDAFKMRCFGMARLMMRPAGRSQQQNQSRRR